MDGAVRCHYAGASAGVLMGTQLITLSGVRRASDPKVAAENAAELLHTALKRVGNKG